VGVKSAVVSASSAFHIFTACAISPVLQAHAHDTHARTHTHTHTHAHTQTHTHTHTHTHTRGHWPFVVS